MSFALNAVYNNYLTTYTPKRMTRYDTHKKSELRGLYNSIVKMNKDAPWYLPVTSKATQNYAVNIKENARELHNTIAQLGGTSSDGLWDKKSAYSSNEDVATVTYVGHDDPGNTTVEFDIEVQSLASRQENMGLFMEDKEFELPPDTYSFDVSINDMNYEFQFTVSEDDTNKEVQSRLVRLINNANIGIKADLIDSEGKTSLRMTSESTGLPNGKSQIFKVSDNHTSKTSGVVDYFGLDYTTREAANAHFTINGDARAASSNRFTVGKAFEVQLNGVSSDGESVQIGLKADIDSLTDNVTHLICGYNEFMKAASSYLESQSKSSTLVKEMKGIAALYRNPMESMGVNLAEDGTLEFDKNLITQTAMQSEDIPETFSYLKDFSNSLLRKSSQVSLNPMDYVEKTMVAYKRPGQRNFVSPYNSSAYSGMMFNSYC